jgi:glycosyltransferase involved in cell wall biosynthesis
LRILHLHSSFHGGGKELRAARLINAFGRTVEHTIVSAVPDALGAAAAIDSRIKVAYPRDFPSLTGKPFPGRLQRLARAMQGFDLVLTYNWGAMDGVMAHTLFAQLLHLPPLVHHEDGFNEDEVQSLKRSRNWYRRIALGRASALVVPSKRLEEIALKDWQQPRQRVRRIVNGVDTAAFSVKPPPDALPRIVKRPDEMWLGTLAGLRPVKNLTKMVRCFDALPEPWQLVIVGTGPEREAILAEARRLSISDRVHLPGFCADPAKAIGLFDLFVLTSDSEQFPLSVIEAMAGGLAVVAPDVGDISAMVSEPNRPFIVDPRREDKLIDALVALASEPDLRQAIGRANRAQARKVFDQKAMIQAYREVYARALRRSEFP